MVCSDRMVNRYIEFYERESIPRAIALSGTVMRGVPVMVKFSEAEKNLAAQQVCYAFITLAGSYLTQIHRCSAYLTPPYFSTVLWHAFLLNRTTFKWNLAERPSYSCFRRLLICCCDVLQTL